MNLYSNDINDGQPIDTQFAFGQPDADEHMSLAPNRNPHLRWEDAPMGTRSYALFCVDPEVPADASDANQEGKSIPVDAERVDFYHWIMVNIPASVQLIEQGACSDGVEVGGKDHPPGPEGSQQGKNDYTRFMAGSDMAGDYYGYDGPCPPWNDEKRHSYHFIVYALDVEELDRPDDFDGDQARQAIRGHILDQAEISGTYSLNPELL